MKRLSIFKGGVLTNQLDFSTIEELEQQFEYHKSIKSFGENATQNEDESWNPAEYQVVIGDAIKSQEEINQESKNYLRSTDWYITRWFETSMACPQDILDARAAARAAVVD
jgi:hypothetical protein